MNLVKFNPLYSTVELAIRTPLYSYNSLFVQHVHTTFDSSFVRCSAIWTHTVIYRAKEDKLQQKNVCTSTSNVLERYCQLIRTLPIRHSKCLYSVFNSLLLAAFCTSSIFQVSYKLREVQLKFYWFNKST